MKKRGVNKPVMRGRTVGLLAAAALAALALGCGGGSVAFREGRKAELRKDYDTALVDYQKAVREQPENAHYRIHEQAAREHAALFHFERGKELLAKGQTEDAAGEFQKALGIDPSNLAARQELDRILAAQATAKRARQQTIEKSLKKQLEESTYPQEVRLQAFPEQPLAHFRISADSRRVYETLAKLANMNVAFTSDFQPRPVSLDLTDVKIGDALRLLSYQTKTFWKAVTPNTFMVIPDTPANRRDYEDEVMRTVYLTNPLKPADRTAITTALKQILGLQRIIDNPDANAIIVRDTPDKVAEAERLIHDLDRGKAEILIDVAVVEADRSRVQDLGLTQVPTSPLSGANIAGLGFTAVTNATTVVNGTSTTVTLPGLPLNRLGKISTSNFSVVVPGAVANALLTDSHTHVLQNPQVRVTDGETAKLRIGSRVPYATGSFLPSFGGVPTSGSSGTGNFGLLSSTQFQYQDVGVNLDITPHLLANGDVDLHSSIEVSSVGQTYTIGGLNEPSFNQRKIDHDIRLKEGEVSILGGLIQSQESHSVSGLPGLGDVPFLRYLFSTTHTEHLETEVLVMLTPYVIRLPETTLEGPQAVSAGGDSGAAPLPAAQPPMRLPPSQPQP
jgi:general secretion pathway protein D